MRTGLFVAVVALLGSVSCQNNDSHPPLAVDCMTECTAYTGGGGGPLPTGSQDSGSTSPPSTSDAGEADSGAPDAGRSLELTGSVQIVTEADFSVLSPLGLAEVEVSAPSSLGGLIGTRYTGGADFDLKHVETLDTLWVGVSQVSGSQRLMTTLQLVDTTGPDPLSLVIVDRATVEEITGAGTLSTPVQLQQQRGHAVLTFVDATGAPLSNVKVTSTTGTTVAYDAGATYSDLLDATSTRGTVLILNMDATDFPGTTQTVSVSHGTSVTNLDVEVASNSISIATFKVQ